MSYREADVLEKFELVIDAQALALLHSRDYRSFIPLILAKTKVHLSHLTLVEFLAYLYYSKKTGTKSDVLSFLRHLYDVVELDDNVIKRAALIESDLLHHSIIPDTTDLLNSSIAIERGYILVSSEPSRYEVYRKYGLIVISFSELIEAVKELVIRESGRKMQSL